MKEFTGPCIAVDELIAVLPDGYDRIQIVRRVGGDYQRSCYKVHDVVKFIRDVEPLLDGMLGDKSPFMRIPNLQ